MKEEIKMFLQEVSEWDKEYISPSHKVRAKQLLNKINSKTHHLPKVDPAKIERYSN